LPEPIVRLLQWMTRKDPEKRPASYAELLQKIESLEQGKSSSSYKWVAVVLSIIVLFAGAVLWMQFRLATKTQSISHSEQSAKPVTTPVSATIRATVTVSINALPWARVTLIPKGFAIEPIPEHNRITPCNLVLPEGEYTIELSNDSVPQPIRQT